MLRDAMSDSINLDVSAPVDAPAPALHKVVLYGPASVYQGALKCLLESRLSNISVEQIQDESSLLASDGNVIVYDRDLERLTQMDLAELTATLQKVAPRPVLLITPTVHPA